MNDERTVDAVFEKLKTRYPGLYPGRFDGLPADRQAIYAAIIHCTTAVVADREKAK